MIRPVYCGVRMNLFTISYYSVDVHFQRPEVCGSFTLEMNEHKRPQHNLSRYSEVCFIEITSRASVY